MVAYDAMTTPGWLDEKHGGSLRWLEFAYTVVFEIITADCVFLFVGASQIEYVRRRNVQAFARAQLQRNEALRIVSNFLPEKVLQAMRCVPPAPVSSCISSPLPLPHFCQLDFKQ